MNTTADYRFMARALQLASRGLYTTDPNPRVGCVIVRDGEIVGEGWHERAGEAHAEINALRQAGERAKEATVYVTLEPCSHQGRTSACAKALIKAGVGRVVAAMVDPNPEVSTRGLEALHKAGVQVEQGLMRDEAEALNPGFVMRMEKGRPFVRCKLAMSLDGRTAMASGESRWITSADARRDVQRLRARSSAVLTGMGTVLADDPALTVRSEDIDEEPPLGGEWRQPLRVIVDPHLSTPPNAKVLESPGRTLIATRSEEDGLVEALRKKGAEVLRLAGSANTLDLHAVLVHLGELEVNEVLMETGATLSGAMLRAGLIDEIVIYMAPVLMGEDARGLFRLPGLERMEDRVELDISDIRAVGQDWRITAKVRQRGGQRLAVSG